MLLFGSEDPGSAHAMLTTAVAAIGGGTFLMILARKLGLPAIVLLLVGGVLFGPLVLGIVQPDSMGEGLFVLVELAIGLILFEGGLTLRPDGYRTAPAMIKRLLSLGALVTWLTAAVAARFLIPLEWDEAMIAASLIVVTGPTVIGPLLKRVRVRERLHHLLHWEAVLIDPLGVFLAVLCYEWFGQQTGGGEALLMFASRTGVGFVVGLAGGIAILWAVRRRLVPQDQFNIFSIACAVLVFGIAEAIVPKAGLLSVTVAGFTFGFARPRDVKAIQDFSAELTELLIGLLFMLLASRLELQQFLDFGLRGLLSVLAVMFIVRPLAITVCSWGLGFSWRELTFLSWVAPRGIVAASMASLIAINLEKAGAENARMVETFAYSVIVATIFIQGMTAGPLATVLGVKREEARGWLIIGAHTYARRIAAFIHDVAGDPVALVDTNARAIQAARNERLVAFREDAREVDLLDRLELADIGHLLALTDNEDLNARVCANWGEVIPPDQIFTCDSTRHGIAHDTWEFENPPIWTSLPRPSILSAELEAGETSMVVQPASHEPPEGAVRLATSDGKTLTLDTEIDAEEDDAMTLYLVRRTDQLVRCLRPELIVLKDGSCSLEEVLREQLERIRLVRPGLATEALLAELLERERSFPTLLGDGVAVPHAHVDGLDGQACAVACVREGVEFPSASADKQRTPVQLVFLVLTPSDDPKSHLALLARIARVASVDDSRAALLSADTPIDVIEAIRRGSGLSGAS